MRVGIAYLRRKAEERRRKKELPNPKAELRAFQAIVRQLNKCCSKYGRQKPIKNGCAKCQDKEKCVKLFELRCELKNSAKSMRLKA